MMLLCLLHRTVSNYRRMYYWNYSSLSYCCKEIIKQYQNPAYIDSDWCRVINPFALTMATKETLPEWFGIPESREEYIEDSVGKLFFCAYKDEKPVGFLFLLQA